MSDDDNNAPEPENIARLRERAREFLAARGLILLPDDTVLIDGEREPINLARFVVMCEAQEAVRLREEAQAKQKAEEREQERRAGLPYRELCEAIKELSRTHREECRLLREQISEHATATRPRAAVNTYRGPGLGTLIVVFIVTIWIAIMIGDVADAVRAVASVTAPK